MIELTKSEEEIMLIIWDINGGFMSEIYEKTINTGKAYSTINTTVSILESKGFVRHKKFGRKFQYFPTFSKDDYVKFLLNKIKKLYYPNSNNFCLNDLIS